MLAATIGFVALALFGHAALWVSIDNRWHATGYPRPVVKTGTARFYAALAAIPLAVGWYVVEHWRQFVAMAPCGTAVELGRAPIWPFAPRTPWCTCPSGRRCVLASRRHPPPVRLACIPGHRRLPATGHSSHRQPPHAAVLPGSVQPAVAIGGVRVRGRIGRTAAALDGLSICHLSDLHFSRRIERAYFDEVVRLRQRARARLDRPDRRRLRQGDLHRLDARDPGAAARPARQVFRSWATTTCAPATWRSCARAMCRRGLRRTSAGVVECLRRGAGCCWPGNERPWFATGADPAWDQPVRRAPRSSAVPHARSVRLGSPAWIRPDAGRPHARRADPLSVRGTDRCPSWHGAKYASGFFSNRRRCCTSAAALGAIFPIGSTARRK